MFVYKNIVHMPRIKQQAKRVCLQHNLILQPLNADCFYQEPIKANLCRDLPKSRGPPGKNCFEGPVYNKDRLSSTPTFVIKSQKQKFLSNPARWENENDQKYANIGESKSQMLLPKPSSKSLYCNVCKEKYEDYRQHILSEKHKSKVRSNAFNKHILKFSDKYQKKRRAGQFKEKENTIVTSSDFSNVIVIDEDSIGQQQLSKPRKKVKVQNQKTQNQHFNSEAPTYRGFNYYQGSQMVPQMHKYYSFCNGFLPFMNMPPHPAYLPPLLPMLSQQNQKCYNNPLNFFYNHLPNYNTNVLFKPPEQITARSGSKAKFIIIQDDS